jgi:hypothetical protein
MRAILLIIRKESIYVRILQQSSDEILKQRCRIYPCAAPRGGGNFLDLGKFLKIFEPENVSKK